MLLTAFVDDSDMSGEGPVSVLGGWLASAEVWAAFSNDWKALVLDTPAPPVRVFKPTSNSHKNAYWICAHSSGRGVDRQAQTDRLVLNGAEKRLRASEVSKAKL